MDAAQPDDYGELQLARYDHWFRDGDSSRCLLSQNFTSEVGFSNPLVLFMSL